MQRFLFPHEFEERLRSQRGHEWQAFSAIHGEASPVSIRLNPAKTKDHTALFKQQASPDIQSVPWTKHGFYLNERPSFTLDPAFHAGTYYVQEASSMLLEQAILQYFNNKENIRALDLCAAPGGKSTHLLSLLSTNSLLVSNEVIRSRANILAENITKWGHANIVVTNNDPEDFQKLKGFFDLMVVDAPCSGEGLFRKDADAMKEWSVENANLCAMRQQRIVHDVWPALKENGILIYCTCTYNPEENNKNIERFAQELNAEILPLDIDPNWGVQTLDYGYQCFPDKVKGEGFYIAILRKKEAQSSGRMRGGKTVFTKVPNAAVRYQQWLNTSEVKLTQFREFLLAIPSEQEEAIAFVCSNLKTVSAGTTMGTLKHDKLIPDHALAMSTVLNKEDFPHVQASYEEAIAYLRKDVFWQEGLTKGFSLIQYENFTLGWANVLDNRLNNLYPADWRIRMAGN
jgi:16S rRNA C967 or C1407 C5-methylase (RsmB/RsmF family)/NOL1/NOP2/fmu family ribosome biogenesis protein